MPKFNYEGLLTLFWKMEIGSPNYCMPNPVVWINPKAELLRQALGGPKHDKETYSCRERSGLDLGYGQGPPSGLAM
jgi:hypothetical protein